VGEGAGEEPEVDDDGEVDDGEVDGDGDVEGVGASGRGWSTGSTVAPPE
jgi:hypothetical protein